MPLEQVSRRNYPNDLITLINDSFSDEINIYNQAILVRSSALRKTTFVEKKASELGVTFLLSGEIKGAIACTIGLLDKELPQNEYIFFQSLFMETMNILMGNLLTNIEKNSDLMAVCGSPKLLKTSDQLPDIFSNSKGSASIVQIEYTLKTLRDEYTCNIFLTAIKSHIIEV